MKLNELDRANLEIADLKLQLISKTMQELSAQGNDIKAGGEGIIQRFCTENSLDPKQIDINITSGEITSTKKEENKEV
jgi:hypothetical protein